MVNSGNFEAQDLATHQFIKEITSKTIIVTECGSGDDRGMCKQMVLSLR